MPALDLPAPDAPDDEPAALDVIHQRRAAIGAALENVRIQLLRIGAGVGRADDMREEVAALRQLADQGASAPNGPRPIVPDSAREREPPVPEARPATGRRRRPGHARKFSLPPGQHLVAEDRKGDRCERVASQIKQRLAGESIQDRLVSLSDPDARPIRKGKLGKGKGVSKGLGMACSHYISGASKPVNWTGEPHATVKIKLDFDGSLVVLSGAADIGQGSSTILVPTVAEGPGLDPGRGGGVTGEREVGAQADG